MEIIQVLTRLGFSEYEAKAYITLLQNNPLNGYELARESKLPRANVYSVLEKLEDRGAVVRLETPSGTRYAPVPPEELTQHLDDQMRGYLAEASNLLGALSQPLQYDYIWNSHGYESLVEHARFLITQAKHSLLIANSPQESLILSKSLDDAAKKNVDIVTLCLEACQEECGRCKGHLFRYKVAPQENNRWLIVIMDGVELLAGEVNAREEAQSVRTRQRLLVNLTASYIRRSIMLAALLEDLKERPFTKLSPETRKALLAVEPVHENGSWLESLHRLVMSGSSPDSTAPAPSGGVPAK